jgi:hypothetical protein
MLTGRPTRDVVVIVLTLTACIGLLVVGLLVVVALAVGGAPYGSVQPSVEFLTHALGVILGAVLGLLARFSSGGYSLNIWGRMRGGGTVRERLSNPQVMALSQVTRGMV